MKVGQCESIERVTPAHWEGMTRETRLGWPLVRPRLMDLCERTPAALHDRRVRSAARGAMMADRVAGLVEEGARSLLHDLGQLRKDSSLRR